MYPITFSIGVAFGIVEVAEAPGDDDVLLSLLLGVFCEETAVDDSGLVLVMGEIFHEI